MGINNFVNFMHKMKRKLATVALGGNAILRGDQIGTTDEQEKNATYTLENLVFLNRK
jgi:carbamate kinase